MYAHYYKFRAQESYFSNGNVCALLAQMCIKTRTTYFNIHGDWRTYKCHQGIPILNDFKL